MKRSTKFAGMALLASFALSASHALADEEIVDETSETPVEHSIAVFLPEKIDTEWYWYYYTDTSQHLVQTAIEKVLRRKGFNVIDLTAASGLNGKGDLSEFTTKAKAVRIAAEIGATHVIIGTATATMLSRDVAYGVNVFRSQADITAKLVRTSDGKVLAVEEASESAGGQAQKAAGRSALKDAGKKIARSITAAAERELGPSGG